jgi:choline monooxygenase
VPAQSSPIVHSREDGAVAATRQGDRAYYFWLYPNFMINVYEGVMDTNLVVPLSLAKTRVIFDFSSIKQAPNMLRETPKASR